MTDTEKTAAVAAAVLIIRAREKRAAKKLLRADGNMLRDVRKTVATHIDHATAGAVSGDSAADGVRRSRQVAAAMIASLATVIAESRRAARESGAKDIDPDAEVREDPADGARAFSAASALAAAWGAIVMMQSRQTDDDTSRGTMARLVRQTMPLMEGRMRRVAATESADAFNQGRAQAIEARQVANDTTAIVRADAPVVIPGGPYRTPGVPREPSTETRVKVWCAILDMKVCPRCAAMDGKVVREDESFPGGGAPLHPFCRCTFVLVPTPLSGAYLKEALANKPRITLKDTPPLPRSAPPSKTAATVKPLPIKREPVRFADLKPLAVPQDVDGFGHLSEAQFTKRMNAIVETMSPAQREAVSEFTGSTYGEIRRIQRLDEAGIAKFIDAWGEENYAEMRAQADALDALHTPERVMPGTVYRGIRGLTPDVFEEILQQDEVLFAGTSSTSRSPSAVMNEFIDTKSETRHSVLFVIHQETAVPVEALGVDREKEFLVRHNTKFRVLNRSRLEGATNTLILEVKEIP